MARWTDIGELVRLHLVDGTELVPEGAVRVERGNGLRLVGTGVRAAVAGINAAVESVEVRQPVEETWRLLHWGLEPGGERAVRRPDGAPNDLVELGRLVRIELRGGIEVEPRGGPVWLVTSAVMDELWLVAEGGVAPESPAGVIDAIVYDTRKGSTDAWWRHPFDRPGPRLVAGQIERGPSNFTINAHGILR